MPCADRRLQRRLLAATRLAGIRRRRCDVGVQVMVVTFEGSGWVFGGEVEVQVQHVVLLRAQAGVRRTFL